MKNTGEAWSSGDTGSLVKKMRGWKVYNTKAETQYDLFFTLQICFWFQWHLLYMYWFIFIHNYNELQCHMAS